MILQTPSQRLQVLLYWSSDISIQCTIKLGHPSTRPLPKCVLEVLLIPNMTSHFFLVSRCALASVKRCFSSCHPQREALCFWLITYHTCVYSDKSMSLDMHRVFYVTCANGILPSISLSPLDFKKPISNTCKQKKYQIGLGNLAISIRFWSWLSSSLYCSWQHFSWTLWLCLSLFDQTSFQASCFISKLPTLAYPTCIWGECCCIGSGASTHAQFCYHLNKI